MRRVKLSVLSLLVLLGASRSVSALSPDEIALVVNRAVPESTQLAQFYAQARGIPANRIVELDLPFADEIPFDTYERQVTPPIRQFLRARGLEQKVRCLVTFYGVPLRIVDRVNTPQDNRELDKLKAAHQQAMQRLRQIVADGERRAAGIDAAFKPASAEQSLEALAQRMQRAVSTIEAELRKTPDESRRRELTQYLNDAVLKVTGPVEGADIMPSTAPASQPGMSVKELGERSFDPEAREIVRRQARRGAGIFAYDKILQAHIDYLATKETGAALDSELSLLWWPTYRRALWQPNMLNAHFKVVRAPPVVMVMRLDAPTVQIVRDIVATSIRIEREGLAGKLVVDARGLKQVDAKGNPDAFGVFDERLRILAKLIQTKPDVTVVFDDKPEVLPPNSVEDVALYCGWYSLHTYVPAMKFHPGAVGYHVASFELISLRDPAHAGWVRGMLENGVVGTVGPVAEPYLHSFPPPDEFFPLLLTGRKTLAEVYWTTAPSASWMQAFIGDPLYNPYQANPRIKVEDLPAVVQPTQASPRDGR